MSAAEIVSGSVMRIAPCCSISFRACTIVDSDDAAVRCESNGVPLGGLVKLNREVGLIRGQIEHVDTGVVVDAIEIDVAIRTVMALLSARRL